MAKWAKSGIMAHMGNYASRAGDKLAHALGEFGIDPTGWVCADFGSSTGGFVDCLLQHGAKKVYAVETGYGQLDWGLRNDERVVVMERTNALRAQLPEKIDLITIDTSWTRQEVIIPRALEHLRDKGKIISLVKPHYEARADQLAKGKLPEEELGTVMEGIKESLSQIITVKGLVESPIVGTKGKNKEFLLLGEKK